MCVWFVTGGVFSLQLCEFYLSFDAGVMCRSAVQLMVCCNGLRGWDAAYRLLLLFTLFFFLFFQVFSACFLFWGLLFVEQVSDVFIRPLYLNLSFSLFYKCFFHYLLIKLSFLGKQVFYIRLVFLCFCVELLWFERRLSLTSFCFFSRPVSSVEQVVSVLYHLAASPSTTNICPVSGRGPPLGLASSRPTHTASHRSSAHI